MPTAAAAAAFDAAMRSAEARDEQSVARQKLTVAAQGTDHTFAAMHMDQWSCCVVEAVAGRNNLLKKRIAPRQVVYCKDLQSYCVAEEPAVADMHSSSCCLSGSVDARCIGPLSYCEVVEPVADHMDSWKHRAVVVFAESRTGSQPCCVEAVCLKMEQSSAEWQHRSRGLLEDDSRRKDRRSYFEAGAQQRL